MQYRSMNQTDIKVSKLCLGTADYGASIKEGQAYEQLNEFYDKGGNFIDTAHVYNDWVPGELARSEKIIGRWLSASGKRNHMVISTKGAHPDLDTMSVSRVLPGEIQRDLEESLACLQTDYIDLYFLHRDNTNLPVIEILSVLEEAKSAGKIRYYGCSNWKLNRIAEAKRVAEEHGFKGFVCNQVMWSLADINYCKLQDKTLVLMDPKTHDYQCKMGLNAMAYMALAKGYFTKKIKGMAISDNLKAMYDNPSNESIAQELSHLKQSGISPTKVALAYLMVQPFVSIPIVSFSNLEQMQEAMESCDMVLDESVIKQLDLMKHYIY